MRRILIAGALILVGCSQSPEAARATYHAERAELDRVQKDRQAVLNDRAAEMEEVTRIEQMGRRLLESGQNDKEALKGLDDCRLLRKAIAAKYDKLTAEQDRLVSEQAKRVQEAKKVADSLEGP